MGAIVEREEDAVRFALRPGATALRAVTEIACWCAVLGWVGVAVTTGDVLLAIVLWSPVLAVVVPVGVLLVTLAERREIELAPGSLGGWKLDADDALRLHRSADRVVLSAFHLRWTLRTWSVADLAEARAVAGRMAALVQRPLVDTADEPWTRSGLSQATDISRRLRAIRARTQPLMDVAPRVPDELVEAGLDGVRLVYEEPPVGLEVVLGRHAFTNGHRTWLLDEVVDVVAFLQPLETDLPYEVVQVLVVDGMGAHPLLSLGVTTNLRSLDRRRRIANMVWLEHLLQDALARRRLGSMREQDRAKLAMVGRKPR